MPNTNPIIDNVSFCRTFKEKQEKKSHSANYSTASITKASRKRVSEFGLPMKQVPSHLLCNILSGQFICYVQSLKYASAFDALLRNTSEKNLVKEEQ